MSAHPAAAPKANPVPAISPPSSVKHAAAGKDTEADTLAANTTATSPLEPHWEPVVSAATD